MTAAMSITFFLLIAVVTSAASLPTPPSPSPQPTAEDLDLDLFLIPTEEAPSPNLQDSIEDVRLLLPFLNGKCWSSIVGVERCVHEAYQSLVSFRIKLGPKCCNVIRNIDQKCFHNLFASGPFNPVNFVCSSSSGNN